MRILILGLDGYLGWPTALQFSETGHEVWGADNFAKRAWERELGIAPLEPSPAMPDRIAAWNRVSGRTIHFREGDLANPAFTNALLADARPDAIVHYAEQPSAPYSMIDGAHAVSTQVNNVVGTLNLLFAMRAACPSAHLIKLGTMGEYGTPNIDIEEGFIEIEHKGRRDVLPFPKQAGSFYHLSKVHDSHNIQFACRIWGLSSTDLNQGVVYGIGTPETNRDPALSTSFHYDAVFGTALNRFCAQAVLGEPLTVYGKGAQKRGFLNIIDTIQCVRLSAENPPKPGEYRVFNQFTEVFELNGLARQVADAARHLGLNPRVENIPNPRKENEDHYYNPVHTRLSSLGLKPHLLSERLIEDMLKRLIDQRARIDRAILMPTVTWAAGAA